MKNRTLAFVFSFSLLSLNGCASFIADKITSPSSFGGLSNGFEKLAVRHTLCADDTRNHCLTALEPAFSEEFDTKLDELKKDLESLKSERAIQQESVTTESTISYEMRYNQDQFNWKYALDINRGTYNKADPNAVIYVLPGYAIPPEMLLIHSGWIRDISGYRTFILPPANGSDHFEFGLNYVDAIERHSRELKAEKIHIVAISMGAVAGTELHKRLDNSQLYLFAPMSDFNKGVHAVIEHTHRWYASLIPQSSIDAAVEQVIEQSQVDEKAFDLVAKVKQSQGKSHIYLGSEDEVIDSKPWLEEPSLKEQVHVYNENHMTLSAMLNMQLMADFSGHILGKPVSATDAHIVGVLSKNGEQIELAKSKKEVIN